METIQMSISWWIDKQNVVYPYNGILFSHKTNEGQTHATTQMNLENIMLREISLTQNTSIVWLYLHGISTIRKSTDSGSRLMAA